MLRGNPSLRGEKSRTRCALRSRARPSLAGSATLPPRQALAQWLTDGRNPRTARVIANRIWQYHFGRGIVPTPNEFGGLGEPATHPELLDWLAMELTDGGWRLKRMHRAIVLSNTYRMSSRGQKPSSPATRPTAGSGDFRCAGSQPRKYAIRFSRSPGL